VLGNCLFITNRNAPLELEQQGGAVVSPKTPQTIELLKCLVAFLQQKLVYSLPFGSDLKLCAVFIVSQSKILLV
jgi:hypothetical protein